MKELKEILQTYGILGAGGAGFPTYAKLSEQTDTIILNCAECEPLLKVHRQLLAAHAIEIAEVLQIIAETVGAKEIYFAIKPSYRQAVEAVESVISKMSNHVPMRVALLPEVYPAGDEVITIYEVTGKVIPAGKLPISMGVTVFNVETMYNVYRAVFERQPVTDTYLTIAGEVKKPATVRLPIGMKVEQVVALAGGATTDDAVYISGGPMTGKIVLGSDTIGKTTTAILVFPKNHIVIRKKAGNIEIDMRRTKSVCCQCRMCTDLCPRHLLGSPIEPHAFMRAAMNEIVKDSNTFVNIFACSQCGLCEMYACEQSLAPSRLIGECRSRLQTKGIRPTVDDFVQGKVNAMREQRMVPMSRLIDRLGLAKYNLEAPFDEAKIKKDAIGAEISIALNQHIGKPATACVKQGNQVRTGQVIAIAPENELSIAYHASVDGVVSFVNENYIVIKRI